MLLCLASASASAQPVSTIAFGSCLHQDRPQPVWDAIIEVQPDLFVFGGDNVYPDTADVGTLHRAYERLEANEGYRRLRASCPVLATWDDHDYGGDDVGADYPLRKQSEQVFLDFFRAPPEAEERHRPGIYSAHFYGPPGQRVQLLLLDTRYFRGTLGVRETDAECPQGRYRPVTAPGATILGEDQWRWLARQLREPAWVRIIVSSIQVIPTPSCGEKWSNFPAERERLFDTIADSGAAGVILVSGDRHHAEISRLVPGPGGYPLYEITSSGLNTGRGGTDRPNPYRLHAESFRGDNFGVIAVDWTTESPRLTLEVRDTSGRVVLAHELALKELAPQE